MNSEKTKKMFPNTGISPLKYVILAIIFVQQSWIQQQEALLANKKKVKL